MATQREIYDKFMQYWNQQMATVADQPANVQQAYAQQLSAQYYAALDKSEKDKMENEAKKQQNKAALAGIAAAIGGPAALYAGSSLAGGGTAATEAGGLLGLGGAGSGSGAVMQPSSILAEPIAGAAGQAGGATTGAGGVLANAASIPGVAGVAVPAAVIGATALGGKAAYDMLQGKKANPIGRATLGIATGGLSELANATGLFDRKTTRDYAKEKTADLMSLGQDDPQWQQYVQGMREQYNQAPPDPSKPFAGKYSTWDEYQREGLEADNLTGVYGNMKVYGPQYASLDFDTQKALTQANIDANNYESRKGDVLIRDPQKAKEAWDRIVGGAATGTMENPIAMPRGGAQPPGGLIALGQSQRPIGFDEDPNNPGRYIRRV